MISSLEIVNFRCFERFEAQGFGRVNLLVGTNNSGKTSLLEAIELWAARGSAGPIIQALDRRGELIGSRIPGRSEAELAVRHLFHGHDLEPDRFFEIKAAWHGTQRVIRATIQHRPWTRREQLFAGDQPLDPPGAESLATMPDVGLLFLQLNMKEPESGEEASRTIPLSLDDGLRRAGSLIRAFPSNDEEFPARLVTTRSLTPGEVAEMFGEIVLTDEEPLILNALKTIEPTVERLALGDVRRLPALFVRLAGKRQRIPIGSMGDGIWRMLALALTLVNVRGGVLLVDEIDTGLHFSVMTDMWKMLIETAQRLDVQVFATSHSRDCYESLATVLRQMNAPAGTAAIHRIERDKGRTVVFDEQEIIIAAERGTEVR